MRTKSCIYCEKYFQTSLKYAYVCPDCKEKNKKNKVMKNLLGVIICWQISMILQFNIVFYSYIFNLLRLNSQWKGD